MNILTVSSLYPNNVDLKHGIFVETRLRHLIQHFPEIKVTVIAPVPWFPFSSKKFGEYAKYAGVFEKEIRHNIEIYHPKYLVIPKIGMYITPFFMSRAISKTIKKLIRTHAHAENSILSSQLNQTESSFQSSQSEGRNLKTQPFDIIDGHYFYPDGVAIEIVASKFNIPFTCTARGTDINLIPQYPKALKMIRKVFQKSAHLMAVCQALSDEMMKLGADKNKITTLRNGVDLELFKASNEQQQNDLKKELSISNKLVVTVGGLVERKGHYLIIDAISQMNNTTLAIAGDGPDKKQLENQVNKLGLSNRVLFLGNLPQKEINKWFQAADVSVLASSREGWANVLLESMASGTPVVATKVWGTPEVVSSDTVGVLVERNVNSIKKGLITVLNKKIARFVVRQYAEEFDWYSTSYGQHEIFTNHAKQ